MYLWASPSTRVRPSVCVRWFVPDSRSEIQINPNSKVLAQKHILPPRPPQLSISRDLVSHSCRNLHALAMAMRTPCILV